MRTLEKTAAYAVWFSLDERDQSKHEKGLWKIAEKIMEEWTIPHGDTVTGSGETYVTLYLGDQIFEKSVIGDKITVTVTEGEETVEIDPEKAPFYLIEGENSHFSPYLRIGNGFYLIAAPTCWTSEKIFDLLQRGSAVGLNEQLLVVKIASEFDIPDSWKGGVTKEEVGTWWRRISNNIYFKEE